MIFRFDSKKAATEAIVGTHGADINGYSVRCSWGKETPDTSSSASAQTTSTQVPQVPQPVSLNYSIFISLCQHCYVPHVDLNQEIGETWRVTW